jgi:hypothetical protein
MSIVFGDLDPEDAYDAGDPPEIRVAVLERIAVALRDNPDDGRRALRRLGALRLLDNLDLEHPDLDATLDPIRHILEAL